MMSEAEENVYLKLKFKNYSMTISNGQLLELKTAFLLMDHTQLAYKMSLLI
jgi:hypothetical protein